MKRSRNPGTLVVASIAGVFLLAAGFWIVYEAIAVPSLQTQIRGGLLDRILRERTPDWVLRTPLGLRIVNSRHTLRMQALAAAGDRGNTEALTPDLLQVLHDRTEPWEIRVGALEALESIASARAELEQAIDELASGSDPMRRFAVDWKLNQWRGSLRELGGIVRESTAPTNSAPLLPMELEMIVRSKSAGLSLEPR